MLYGLPDIFARLKRFRTCLWARQIFNGCTPGTSVKTLTWNNSSSSGRNFIFLGPPSASFPHIRHSLFNIKLWYLKLWPATEEQWKSHCQCYSNEYIRHRSSHMGRKSTNYLSLPHQNLKVMFLSSRQAIWLNINM